jgi:hypothetical protein
MFYQEISWWVLLGVGFVFNLIWSIGHYGRGNKSEVLESIFGIMSLIVPVISFFINGILAGIVLYVLTGIFTGINKSLSRKVLVFLSKL